MAQSTRQTSLLVNQDWTKVYQSFTNADFTSYDFETLRSSMINYIKTYYPETFNDFLESSEYLALIDMIAFLGQSLAFRTDLNARENFIDTAQRRDSILKLARMLSYNPHRTTAAQGLLKIDSVKTTETITDSSGINLANATVHWNDLTNDNWLEQFTTIVNASLVSSEQIGKPGNSQLINNIQTDEYSINLNPNTLPVAPFQVNVQGTATGFEAVSATSVGESYIYADDPTKAGQFNILYQNDNNGNGSNNTGFFVFFKQGSLNSTTFNITNAIPNNFISVKTNNITNIDQWLYQLNVAGSPTTKWTPVPALPGINVIFNNLTDKNLYQVNTINNDQVNLVFGDGSFANIPQGQFIFYYRTSNGTTFNVGPDDLSFVTIGFSYISQKNTVETLTITASLKYTVTNANSAPTTSSIRTLAPQQYYTQNRMVTGEDYNIFPVTSFSSIQKIKAVNRTSSGVSLFLDAIDPTGSYSATNIFGDDGSITANTSINSTTFSFLSINDIYSAIYNNVIPVLSKPEVRNYYYANVVTRYNSISSNITFNQLSNSTSTSSGYLFMPNVAYTIGGNITYKNVTQQVGAGAITSLGNITAGASVQFTAPAGNYFDAQHVIKTGTPVNSGDSTSFYAAVTNVVSNGDVFTPSLVTFGTVVPEGAILSGPLLDGQSCIIPAYKNDITSNLVTTLVNQIQAKSTFGLYYDQVQKAWENIPPSSISGNNNWALYFSYADGIYNLQYKVIDYIFSSSNNTNFYFDPAARVYDSITGKSVKDSIKILKINGLPLDITWDIYNTISGADGYNDPSRVLLTFPTTQLVGVPDNPDLYTIVASAIPSGTNIYFQYKHNAPARSRIDPTPINLIDLYILTASYTSSYISWLRDLTGSITEPSPPTSSSLEIAYATLDNYKTVSDTIVYNPAKFKPLFGAKADPSVQARFQVVINPITGITENEIKTQIVSAINDYFDPSNWDFGDTFYFSELAAYLHTTLAPNLSSIIIVPASNSLVFGNYFQINSEPWEIITSAATVNDIEVVSAVTAATLNLGNTLLGTF
jgi:hypothetical protein